MAREANGLWMSQVGRNLCDAAEGFLIGKRYLIHDRDAIYRRVSANSSGLWDPVREIAAALSESESLHFILHLVLI